MMEIVSNIQKMLRTSFGPFEAIEKVVLATGDVHLIHNFRNLFQLQRPRPISIR
jgi:hypothetical protein